MFSTHIRNLFEKKDFVKVIQFTSKDTFNILNNYFRKFKRDNFDFFKIINFN